MGTYFALHICTLVIRCVRIATSYLSDLGSVELMAGGVILSPDWSNELPIPWSFKSCTCLFDHLSRRSYLAWHVALQQTTEHRFQELLLQDLEYNEHKG